MGLVEKYKYPPTKSLAIRGKTCLSASLRTQNRCASGPANLRPDALLDYVENFILFENKSVKIIAKNHQFLGVNNLMESVYRRKELKGKLGVFWHTQGSGKSYSMVFLAQKIRRKFAGSLHIIQIQQPVSIVDHQRFVV